MSSKAKSTTSPSVVRAVFPPLPPPAVLRGTGDHRRQVAAAAAAARAVLQAALEDARRYVAEQTRYLDACEAYAQGGPLPVVAARLVELLDVEDNGGSSCHEPADPTCTQCQSLAELSELLDATASCVCSVLERSARDQDMQTARDVAGQVITCLVQFPRPNEEMLHAAAESAARGALYGLPNEVRHG
jgi:hypothetical protein